MRDEAPAETRADPAVMAALLEILGVVGVRGGTAKELGLEKSSGPRRAALNQMVTQGRIIVSRSRFLLPALPDAVANKIQTLAADLNGEIPRFWHKKELADALTPAEKSSLDAALACLEETREVLRVPVDRRGERFLFARPLRRWFEGIPTILQPDIMSNGIPADAYVELLAAYTKAVSVSGGFPDVKISTLRASLHGESAGTLAEQLRTLWYEGRVTLSLGDWSLASEEMRASAIELDGERYLLVRFEDPAVEPLPA